ncbi:hypothetical protein [Streptomyces chattanoogensis]|uniref:hypothetical protein n=1 Tax=Streptomyces chattanoogensis TaxID=66876 RepID=UPI00367923D7
MNSQVQTALKTAFQLAEPSLAGPLLTRLRAEVRPLLGKGKELPGRLVEAVVASDDRELCTALVANSRPGACDTAALLRLAELGDPGLGREVYRLGHVQAEPGVQAAVLAAADPADPGWYAPGGLVEMLLGEQGKSMLGPALKGPFPEVVAHAVRLHVSNLPLPVVLDACEALLAHGGPRALADLADTLDKPAHPGLLALLREAATAPDPAALLRNHRAPGEWTDLAAVSVLLRIRGDMGRDVGRGVGGDMGRMPVHVPLDWDLVRREHERQPFRAGKLMALSKWPDCPDDLLLEMFRSKPQQTAQHAARLPVEVLLGAEAREQGFDTDALIRRGVSEGWLPLDRVLAEAAPARKVLGALEYDHEPTRKAVAELVAPLGDDPTAWLTLYKRLRRFQGPASELIAKVCASAASQRVTAWPDPLGPGEPGKDRPEGARRTFLDLFGCAAEEAQLALLPHLDMRAVQHLLAIGKPSPRVCAEVVAVHGTALAAHASDVVLVKDVMDGLLDRDDPLINAHLFEDSRLDQQERIRILAGVGRGGGVVPVDDGLIPFLEGLHLSSCRDWLTAGITSGDSKVLTVVLDRLRLYTEAGRLRLVIALWERQGPDAVREFLTPARFRHNKRSWPARTQRAVLDALDDAPEGLKVLRERLAAEEDPARVVAFLRNVRDPEETADYADRLRRVVSEGTEIPWDGLIRAHAEDPLPTALLRVLVDKRDCPRALFLACLADVHLTSREWWVGTALRWGSLTPEDLVQHARPAAAVVAYPSHRYVRLDESAWIQARAEARKLAREHLGTNVEAWAVALRLLPEFHGTVPELMATSGAVAG